MATWKTWVDGETLFAADVNALQNYKLDSDRLGFFPEDYGAKGDGVTDDSAAIQAALDAQSAAGGGTVYLGSGTYIISSSLVIPSNVNLVGAGDHATILEISSDINGLTTAAGANGWTVSGVALRVGESVGADATHDGVVIGTNNYNFAIRNVLVRGSVTSGYDWRDGLSIAGGWTATLDRVQVTAATRYALNHSGWAMHFDQCDFSCYGTACGYLNGASQNVFTACKFQGGPEGIKIVGSAGTSNTFIDPWIELSAAVSNVYCVHITDSPSNVFIGGSFSRTGSLSGYMILLDGSAQFNRFIGPRFADFTAPQVRIEGSAIDNQFEGGHIPWESLISVASETGNTFTSFSQRNAATQEEKMLLFKGHLYPTWQMGHSTAGIRLRAGATAVSSDTPAGAYVTMPGGTAPFDDYGNLILKPQSAASKALEIWTGASPARRVRVTDDLVSITTNIQCSGEIQSGLPVVRPEAFGAVGDGNTDDTEAIQDAIDSLSSGRGIVLFGAKTYKTTACLTVAQDRVFLVGSGKNATQIGFYPTGTATCVKFQKAGGQMLVQCGLRDIGLYGLGSAVKTGLNIIDADIFDLTNVAIYNMIDDTHASVGLKYQGRDFLSARQVDIYADTPLWFSDNPNHTIDIDHAHFQDLYLIAHSSKPCLLIDSGVNLTNVTFDGAQGWAIGKNAVYWNDTTSSLVSSDLRIENLRWEQETSSSDYMFYIKHNTGLYHAQFTNCYGGATGKGYYLRNVNLPSLKNCHYLSATNEAMNVDNTVLGMSLDSCFWQAGGTASMSGQRVLWATPKWPNTAPLPMSARYDSTANSINEIYIDSPISSTMINMADHGKAGIATEKFCGFAIVTCGVTVNAIYVLRGLTHTVDEVSDVDGWYSKTEDQDGQINIYWDAGNSRYEINNESGGTYNFNVVLIGNGNAFV